MAVLNSVPGLEVKIVVNGEPLQEYVDNEDELAPNTVLKYVEATSGAEFTVQYTITSEFTYNHDMSLRVYVDGVRAVSNVRRSTKDVRGTCVFEERRSGGGEDLFLRKFAFSELTIGKPVATEA
jgi:hypothetical protein